MLALVVKDDTVDACEEVKKLGSLSESGKIKFRHTHSGAERREGKMEDQKGKRERTCEEFLQVRLDDGRVGRLAEDLQQVVVSDEIEARKRRAFFLKHTHMKKTPRQPGFVLSY